MTVYQAERNQGKAPRRLPAPDGAEGLLFLVQPHHADLPDLEVFAVDAQDALAQYRSETGVVKFAVQPAVTQVK